MCLRLPFRHVYVKAEKRGVYIFGIYFLKLLPELQSRPQICDRDEKCQSHHSVGF